MAPDCSVTLIAYRGFPAMTLFDCCQPHGWHDLMRLNADTTQGPHIRLIDGRVCPVWELVRGPGQRWQGTVAIIQSVG